MPENAPDCPVCGLRLFGAVLTGGEPARPRNANRAVCSVYPGRGVRPRMVTRGRIVEVIIRYLAVMVITSRQTLRFTGLERWDCTEGNR